MLRLLCLLCACAGASDAQRYADASRLAPADARDACLGIRAPAARDDCLVATASRAAAMGATGAAEGICGDVSTRPWSDECWFVVADATEAIGEAAQRLCERAGQYHEPCLGHALTREVRALPDPPIAVGDEEALERVVRRVVRDRTQARGNEAGAKVRGVMAELLSLRWLDRPFDPALCGTAEPEACEQGYRNSIQTRAPGLDPDRACGHPLTSAEAEALGVPGFTADGEAMARQAWRTWCVQFAGVKPP